MASTAKLLSSSLPVPAARNEPAVRAVPAPAPRERSGWVLRDVLGGVLLIAAVIALWTATWAAIAGPLSPAQDAGARAAVSTVEGER